MVSEKTQNLITTLKQSDLTKFDNLNLLFEICLNILPDDEQLALKTAKFVKYHAALTASNPKFFELYNRALLFLAPFDFDSYLLYLEKDRDPKSRFYLPRRKQLMKLGLIQALQELETGNLEILSLSLPPGTGKAQPLYSKILTPNGFINMGDVKAGTKVISGTGKECNVISVYPQGIKSIYELTFNDGSTCRCSDEHLWTVQTRDDRRTDRSGEKGKYRTIELKTMMRNIRVENGKRFNYSIDYVPKIEFTEKRFLIHPYVLGALIGDGSLTSGNLNITSADQELLDKIIRFLPKSHYIQRKDKYNYRINGGKCERRKDGTLKKCYMRKSLEYYGLYGKKSIEKFIPKEYLLGSYEQRLWLLRGLMDTDGYAANKNTNVSYSTISEQLAIDVTELVHSLGGYASTSKSKAGYKNTDGNYIQCNDCYTVTIAFDSSAEKVFTLTRKNERYNPKRKAIKRFIKDIKYIGEEECQCIYIDDPSHLYITDNYVITHNTTLGEFFISWVIGRDPEKYNLFVSHSGDITRMFYDAINNITSGGEYLWNDVFPTVKKESENAKIEQINFGKFKPFKSIQCTSVGSKNAGKVRCNGYLYCDDLIGGIEEALSKVRLDKLWTTYSVDLRQRKKDGCKEIHVATRWSVHDVIGRLQMKFGNSDKAKFIAIPDIDPETQKSNFAYDYGVGYSEEYFHDQEDTMDDISYKCLYKSKPIEREGLLYTEEELRRYLELPVREPDAIIGICDTKNEGTDFMFLPAIYQYGEDYYCVDCVCDDTADFGVQEENCANIIVDHNMQQCQFESNNGGSRVAYNVNTLVKKKNGRCNITSQVTTANKQTKIIVNADWVKKHVLFKDKENYKSKEPYGIMMGFLLSYSVKGKNPHDDVPDGFAQLALYTTNMYGTTVKIIDRSQLGI